MGFITQVITWTLVFVLASFIFNYIEDGGLYKIKNNIKDALENKAVGVSFNDQKVMEIKPKVSKTINIEISCDHLRVLVASNFQSEIRSTCKKYCDSYNLDLNEAVCEGSSVYCSCE